MSGRSKALTAERIAKESLPPRAAAGGTKLAVLCWAVVRTTRRSASGWRQQRRLRDSSASQWDAQLSGIRWWPCETKRQREKLWSRRLPAAIGNLWTSLKGRGVHEQ